jgi:pimeloyl-ACP methyl ester carboxylesterase
MPRPADERVSVGSARVRAGDPVGHDVAMTVRNVEVGGVTIVVTDSDMGSDSIGRVAGQTFVLLHGIGMGASYFAALSAELQPHGRVVAIDLPGFGNAPEPEVALTMAQLGRLLVDFVVLEALGDPVLVGHSMGAQVAVEAAAQRPELFRFVVLMAPTVNRHERNIRVQALRLLQDLFGESPTVILLGLQNYAKAGPLWFAKKLRMMMAHEIECVLPGVHAHTLVIRGAHDRVCPRGWAQEVAALIPDARMVEIDGRGHETMVKDAAAAARLIVEHVR